MLSRDEIESLLHRCEKQECVRNGVHAIEYHLPVCSEGLGLVVLWYGPPPWPLTWALYPTDRPELTESCLTAARKRCGEAFDAVDWEGLEREWWAGRPTQPARETA